MKLWIAVGTCALLAKTFVEFHHWRLTRKPGVNKTTPITTPVVETSDIPATVVEENKGNTQDLNEIGVSVSAGSIPDCVIPESQEDVVEPGSISAGSLKGEPDRKSDRRTGYHSSTSPPITERKPKSHLNGKTKGRQKVHMGQRFIPPTIEPRLVSVEFVP